MALRRGRSIQSSLAHQPIPDFGDFDLIPLVSVRGDSDIYHDTDGHETSTSRSIPHLANENDTRRSTDGTYDVETTDEVEDELNRSSSEAPSETKSTAHQAKPSKSTLFRRISQPLLSLEAHIDRRLRRSRFNGWRMGVLSGCCMSACVLCCNLAIIAVGAVSQNGYDRDGIADLIYGDDATISRWNTIFHIFINALSTILLSGSNYTMQVLSSPTRDDIDAAHAKGRWLDVGILSPRNLRAIPRKRALLWMLLGFSSIPLHLFYNAAVFKVVTSNDYNILALDINTVQYTRLRNMSDHVSNVNRQNATYQYLDSDDWFNFYNRRYMSVNGDLYLAIHYVAFRTSFDLPNTNMSELVQLNMTGSQEILRSHVADSARWFLRYEVEPRDKNLTTFFLRVAHALSQKKGGPTSRVQISLYFMLVVVACNLFKLGVMAFVLYGNRSGQDSSAYLVTLGDAAASFLLHPDAVTVGRGPLGKEEIVIHMGKPPRRQIMTATEKERFHERLQGTWLPRRMSNFTPVSRQGKVILTELYICIIIIFAFIPFYWNNGSMSWSTASDDTLSLSINQLTSAATIMNAALANLPQIVLSFTYLSVNTICTAMAGGMEWNKLATSRKGLRVTKPNGNQRSTYFLQLPYKWSVPLMVFSGTLHWLLSQAFFLVRVDTYNRQGQLAPEKSKSACGFSASSLFAVVGAALGLLILLTVIGMLKKPMRAPVVASCSLAISAACHPPPGEVDTHLAKVQWGETEQTLVEGVAHCSLSSKAVTKPTVGKRYA